MDIIEEAFDSKLNPIRATICLTMEVTGWKQARDSISHEVLRNYIEGKHHLAKNGHK